MGYGKKTVNNKDSTGVYSTSILCVSEELGLPIFGRFPEKMVN